MQETLEQRYLRQLKERRIAEAGIRDDFICLLFQKMQESADTLQAEYDNVDIVAEPSRAIAIQQARKTLLERIPALVEGIMNAPADPESSQQKWNFRTWFKSTFGRLWFVTGEKGKNK